MVAINGREKEEGLNMINIAFPMMIFFLAIMIFYYCILWDNIKLAQEELHNGLQIAESAVISGGISGDKTERDRTHIVWSVQKKVGNGNYEYDVTSPILDGTLQKVKNNYENALNEVFKLENHKPTSGAITALSKSKGIYTKEFFIIEKIYYREDDKSIESSLRGKFKEYVVYAYDCNNNTLTPPTTAITGDGVTSYLRKVGGNSADKDDENAIVGSTLYVTIEYREIEGETRTTKVLRNPISKNYKAISNVSVTEVMDIVAKSKDNR